MFTYKWFCVYSGTTAGELIFKDIKNPNTLAYGLLIEGLAKVRLISVWIIEKFCVRIQWATSERGFVMCECRMAWLTKRCSIFKRQKRRTWRVCMKIISSNINVIFLVSNVNVCWTLRCISG